MKVMDLPARAGWLWIGTAFQLYRRAPLALSLMAGGWLGIILLLFLVPLIGQLAMAALQPVLTAGFLLAIRGLAENAPVVPNSLFAAFRQANFRDLMLVGLIESVLVSLSAGIAMQYVLGSVTFEAGASPTDPKTVEVFKQALQGKEWAFVLAGIAIVVVKGLFWFVVPLLAFNPDMRLGHALRWGVYATLSNIGAMIFYGLATLAFSLALMLPSALLPPLAILLLGIGIPVVIASSYVGYREAFSSM
jgi:hypothetical protein